MAQPRTNKLGQPKKGKLGKITAPKGSDSTLGADALNPNNLAKPNQGAGNDKNFDRAVASLATAIRALQTEDGSESVDARVEIGQKLHEVQAQLPHGVWLTFLADEVGYPYRTARRLIQLGQWAPNNVQVLARVRGWGPTKVYQVMDAGPALAKRLLSRKGYVVASGKKKALERLTTRELQGVLSAMGSRHAGSPQPPKVDEAAEVLRLLRRDSKRVIRGVNELARLKEEGALGEEAEEALAEVSRRLLRSWKKLENMMDGES